MTIRQHLFSFLWWIPVNLIAYWISPTFYCGGVAMAICIHADRAYVLYQKERDEVSISKRYAQSLLDVIAKEGK